MPKISPINEAYADALAAWAKRPRTDLMDDLVDRFLVWPLPKTVCSDTCVSDPNYKFYRSGTNLLNADEARQMFEYLFAKPL